MRGGNRSYPQVLGSAGLEVVGDGESTEAVLGAGAAWRAVASEAGESGVTGVAFAAGRHLAGAARTGEAGPAFTARAGLPGTADEVNAQWHRLATAHGVLGTDGSFLLDVGGRPTRWETRPWRRVRLTGRWDLAGVLPEVPGQPRFLTLSTDGDALVGVTVAGDEVRIVALDGIRERREAAARAAAGETPEERDAAWAEFLGRGEPAEALHGLWADGLVRHPALPEDLTAVLLGRSQWLMYQRLPTALVEAAMVHPDWKVRALLAEVQPNLTAEQRGRMILDEENPRRRWVLTMVAVDARGELTLPTLESLAADPSVETRREATRLTGMPGHLLVALAADGDPSVRSWACDRAWPHLDEPGRRRLLADPDAEVRASAAFRHHREQPMPRAVFAAGDVPGDALEVCRLERDLAEHLARHGEPRQRRGLAGNPHLDPDLVLLLARDPDAAVRSAAAVHPGLTEEQRAGTGFDFDPAIHYHDLDWVVALHGEPEAMRRLAASAHPLVRRSVARARHLPADVVERLAEDEDRVVQLFLAESCDDAPAAMLMRVWQWWTGSLSAPDRPRGHPNFPRRDLLRFADDPSPRMRRLALDDPGSTAELVERLSRDPSAEVRYRAAEDPRLTVAAAVRLLDDESRGVRGAAAHHPGLPARVLARMLLDPDTAAAAAAHPAVPVPVVRRLAEWISEGSGDR